MFYADVANVYPQKPSVRSKTYKGGRCLRFQSNSVCLGLISYTIRLNLHIFNSPLIVSNCGHINA